MYSLLPKTQNHSPPHPYHHAEQSTPHTSLRGANVTYHHTRHCEERSDVAISLHIITLPYISRSTQSNRIMYFVIAKHCKFPKYLSRSTRNHPDIYFVRGLDNIPHCHVKRSETSVKQIATVLRASQ